MPPRPGRDLLQGYTFHVKWDNRYIPHVSLAGPLFRTSTPIEVREGGDPNTVRIEPGRITWPPVVLQRPITADTAFEQWANLLVGGPPAGALLAFRKDVTIEIYTGRGRLALRYVVHRAWPQAYEALPTLGPTPRRHILETLTLFHDGWQRDSSVAFPS